MSADAPRQPARSTRTLALLGLLCAVSIAALTALGVWQLERRVWKLHLIDDISRRVQAAPVEAPGPAQWPRVAAGDYSYRRVTAVGEYLNGRETLVLAVTRLGGGYWILTPLRTEAGYTMLVNRGFVPAERHDAAARSQGRIDGRTIVSGLLRVSEPGGGFLHENDAAADRWYSRDVAAIAGARRLTDVAPYFVDADATPLPGGLPIGGLTVVDPPNHHLVYALTWFALALALGVAAGAAGSAEWRKRARP